jgi:DNA-binding response OmpR family regulator
LRILIVEDEKEIADGVQKILKNEGYQIDTVYDGLSGLDYILSGVYDLILLDIMLPKINGLDILKNARNEGITIPIILLTAKSQVDDKILGLDSGADDYLTKPFDAGELLARIRVRTRSARETDGNLLIAYDICLEKSTYKLCRNDKSVKLANKEYQLLEYLMMNKGQILSRDMLVTKVWGFDEEADYNSLEVYISFLRKKLRFVGAKASIVTTKGVGYFIEERENND